MSSTTSLANLPLGASARILSYHDTEISLKLIEMGCIPGTLVTMIRKAPFGDPLAFACEGSLISIRAKEASTVTVEVEHG